MKRQVERRQIDDLDDQLFEASDRNAPDFMARVLAAAPSPEALDNLRMQYGEEVPEDVLEQIARQQIAAQPLLERYHMLKERQTDVALARATASRMIDETMDIWQALDLGNPEAETDFPDEFVCPECGYGWSGSPNLRTGANGNVYVPTGRINFKTGRMAVRSYGVASTRRVKLSKAADERRSEATLARRQGE